MNYIRTLLRNKSLTTYQPDRGDEPLHLPYTFVVFENENIKKLRKFLFGSLKDEYLFNYRMVQINTLLRNHPFLSQYVVSLDPVITDSSDFWIHFNFGVQSKAGFDDFTVYGRYNNELLKNNMQINFNFHQDTIFSATKGKTELTLVNYSEKRAYYFNITGSGSSSPSFPFKGTDLFLRLDNSTATFEEENDGDAVETFLASAPPGETANMSYIGQPSNSIQEIATQLVNSKLNTESFNLPNIEPYISIQNFAKYSPSNIDKTLGTILLGAYSNHLRQPND